MYNRITTYLIEKIDRLNWKVHHLLMNWKRYMSLIIRIIIINYIVLMLNTIYNKSNAMVKKNSSAQPEDWSGNSNQHPKFIKQKGNPQWEAWTSKIKNLNEHCWI